MIRRLAVVLLLTGATLAGCAQAPEDDAYSAFMRQQQDTLDEWISRPGAATQPASAPSEPRITEQSDLKDCLAYAARHNPELEAAFDAWKAALERVPRMRALPDPQFTYSNYIEMSENAYEIAQMFPWLGKLDLRGDVAAEEAQAARFRFDAAMLKLFYRVQQAYGEYYYLGRETLITQQNIELLNQIEAIARTRYATGAAGHPDMIRAQVEQGRLADRLRTLQKLRTPTAARLNAVMNRPAASPLPWPKSLSSPQGDFSDEQLIAWAAQANPEVRAMDRELAARGDEIRLARREYIPDIMLSASHDPMMAQSRDNPYIAMVSVNVPLWWNRISAGVREARWRRLQAINEKAAFLNNLGADVEMALFEFQDAGRKIGLYRDTLIPKAEQALQASQSAYGAGAASFQDYLDAQRVLLEFQLSYERSLTDRAQRLAELEVLVGKPLTDGR
jgi:outer membrane protein TolC